MLLRALTPCSCLSATAHVFFWAPRPTGRLTPRVHHGDAGDPRSRHVRGDSCLGATHICTDRVKQKEKQFAHSSRGKQQCCAAPAARGSRGSAGICRMGTRGSFCLQHLDSTPYSQEGLCSTAARRAGASSHAPGGKLGSSKQQGSRNREQAAAPGQTDTFGGSAGPRFAANQESPPVCYVLTAPAAPTQDRRQRQLQLRQAHLVSQ